ncbi:hypothetical protein BWZ43_25135, partial [Heyndrickxia oleronia]
MKREDLLAPKEYNIVEEIEKYASSPSKLAIKWVNELGETKEITYKELINKVTKTGNVFLENGLKKGDTILVIIPRII